MLNIIKKQAFSKASYHIFIDKRLPLQRLIDKVTDLTI